MKMMMNDLPPIPDKRYFTIGEVSQLCQLKTHVLRYWEQEFTQLKPCKRRGNRRYYQRKDVLIVRKIKSLLYDQGYTINGARAQLSGKKPEEVIPMNTDTVLQQTITELEAIANLLQEETHNIVESI